MSRKNKHRSTPSPNDVQAQTCPLARLGRTRATSLAIERRGQTDAERQQFETAFRRMLAELVRAHRSGPQGKR